MADSAGLRAVLLVVVAVTAVATPVAAAGATADPGAVGPAGELREVSVTAGEEGLRVRVVANTTLAGADPPPDPQGEPYLTVAIDGERVAETEELAATGRLVRTVTVERSVLDDLAPGSHEVTVRLRDDDPLSDDLVDGVTREFALERGSGLTLAVSRSDPVVGAPVSLRLSGVLENPAWRLDGPPGSDATLRSPGGGVRTLRAETPGTYRVTVTPAGASEPRATATVEVRRDDGLSLLRRYAPRLHYHPEERYRPTRVEAFVHNARLEEFGEPDVDRPTVFDLADRGEGWELDLRGDRAEYPSYDDGYPPTVYGSVHRDVEFRGDRYTAVTYWLFYVYDPKQPGSIAALTAHESDLETVTVLVNDSGAQYVGASQHYGGEVRDWTRATGDDDRLDVYPAVGAHSNYLVDTSRYEGGLPIQRQYVARLVTDTDLFEPSVGVYEDRTGSARVLASAADTGADADDTYELAVLTGREVWASYGGVFGADDDAGAVPMARQRWRRPGLWMSQRLVPYGTQRGADMETTLSVTDGRVGADLTVRNGGVKPTEFVAVLETKPTGATWDDPAATTLDRRTVPLGVDAAATTSLSAPTPDTPGTWDLRVRVVAGGLPATDETTLAVEWVPRAVTVDPPTDTGTPTTGTEAPPSSLPGVGVVGAVLAVLAALGLLWRR